MEELLIKEIARYTECYETDMVKLDTIIEGIRQQVMFMRMQPISAIFDMAARIVRPFNSIWKRGGTGNLRRRGGAGQQYH